MVPDGPDVHCNGGDTFVPAHVKSLGIMAPSTKAVLVSTMVAPPSPTGLSERVSPAEPSVGEPVSGRLPLSGGEPPSITGPSEGASLVATSFPAASIVLGRSAVASAPVGVSGRTSLGVDASLGIVPACPPFPALPAVPAPPPLAPDAPPAPAVPALPPVPLVPPLPPAPPGPLVLVSSPPQAASESDKNVMNARPIARMKGAVTRSRARVVRKTPL